MRIGGARPGAGEHREVEPYHFVEEPELKEAPLEVSDPRCGGPTRVGMATTDLWRGESLIVLEDTPAHVCDRRVEQFYSQFLPEQTMNILLGYFHWALRPR